MRCCFLSVSGNGGCDQPSPYWSLSIDPVEWCVFVGDCTATMVLDRSQSQIDRWMVVVIEANSPQTSSRRCGLLFWFGSALNSVRGFLFLLPLCECRLPLWMRCVCVHPAHLHISTLPRLLRVRMRADVDISLHHSLPLSPLLCWQLCVCVCVVPEPQGPICCHAGHWAPLRTRGKWWAEI